MVKFAHNKDNIAKLTALITAIVLWFIVMNEQNPPADATYSVPLHVRNVQAEHFITNNNESVEVVVRGPRSIVGSASADEFYAYIDMAQMPTGNHKVKVHVVIPSGLELIGVTPDKCDVTLDKMITEKRKVELSYSGLATEGVKVDEVKMDVEEVALDGASLVLGRVAKVIAHIDLAKKEQDFSEEAALKAVDSEGQEVTGLTITPSKATIKGKVISVPVNKTVDVNFQMVGNMPPGLALKSIKADIDQIVISGYRPNLEDITALNAEPLDLSNITESTTVQLRVILPEGITAEQKTITVSVDVVRKAR